MVDGGGKAVSILRQSARLLNFLREQLVEIGVYTSVITIPAECDSHLCDGKP